MDDCGNCKSGFWQTVKGEGVKEKQGSRVVPQEGELYASILVRDFSWPFLTHLWFFEFVNLSLSACGIVVNHTKLWLAHLV